MPPPKKKLPYLISSHFFCVQNLLKGKRRVMYDKGNVYINLYFWETLFDLISYNSYNKKK